MIMQYCKLSNTEAIDYVYDIKGWLTVHCWQVKCAVKVEKWDIVSFDV